MQAQDVRRRNNETIKNLYLIQHCIIQGETISLREQITISLTFRLKYICICSFIFYIYILENLGIDFFRWFKSKADIGDGDTNWGNDKPSKTDNKVGYLF